MYINHKYAWWLKEQGGFNEWCSRVYDRNGNMNHTHGSGGINSTHSKEYCSAPPYEKVRGWLKTKGYYYLSIEPQEGIWRWMLYNLRTREIDAMDLSGCGWWDAEKAGVEKALELLTGFKADSPSSPVSRTVLISKKKQLRSEISRIKKMITNVRGELEAIRKYYDKELKGEEDFKEILDNMVTGEEFLEASKDTLLEAEKLC